MRFLSSGVICGVTSNDNTASFKEVAGGAAYCWPFLYGIFLTRFA